MAVPWHRGADTTTYVSTLMFDGASVRIGGNMAVPRDSGVDIVDGESRSDVTSRGIVDIEIPDFRTKKEGGNMATINVRDLWDVYPDLEREATAGEGGKLEESFAEDLRAAAVWKRGQKATAALVATTPGKCDNFVVTPKEGRHVNTATEGETE